MIDHVIPLNVERGDRSRVANKASTMLQWRMSQWYEVTRQGI